MDISADLEDHSCSLITSYASNESINCHYHKEGQIAWKDQGIETEESIDTIRVWIRKGLHLQRLWNHFEACHPYQRIDDMKGDPKVLITAHPSIQISAHSGRLKLFQNHFLVFF